MTAARMGKGAAKAPELTVWYSPILNPAIPGVYETRTAGQTSGEGYQYWTGTSWGKFSFNVDNAFGNRNHLSMYQDNEWRGLASDPNGVTE